MSILKTKDGVEIFYKDWGKGQPIAQHGLVLNQAKNSARVPILQRRCSWITINRFITELLAWLKPVAQKQGHFRRKQGRPIARIPVITVMIYGFKGRLTKKNNRENYTIKRKPFFIFSKSRRPHAFGNARQGALHSFCLFLD